MGNLGNLDGSFESMLKMVEQLDGLPKIVQKYMTAGIFQDQLGWASRFDNDSVDRMGGVDAFAAQLVNLSKTQQDVFLSTSKLNSGLKEEVERLVKATQAGEKFNAQLFEQKVSNSDVSKGVLNELISAGGLKDDNGNYALPDTDTAIAGIEDYVNQCKDAEKINQLFNAGIIEQQGNLWKLSPAFLKDASVKGADTVATVVLTTAQKAWNIAMQLGKQLLLSLGVAAVAFIATKIVDYIMNLKTRSEELVDAMNDSHDKAEQATKDVEEIQSKIDELNKSLKDAGVKKIEDIVDPAERERLQTINDMLQAQLDLKKQLEKDANNKANADTSAVVNDKTEDSIVKFRTVNVSYAEGGANAGTRQVAEKVSKTESLEEHIAALNELIDKRRELATAGQEDTQEYKDNEAAITSETEKVEELSSAVSEQISNYSADADNFDQYKDEYVAGTNAMTEATKALANANDDVGVSTTNYDILLQKMQATKNLMDRRNKDTSNNNPYTGAVKTLKASGLETGDDIRELSAVPANQTKAQAEAIKVLENAAKDAGVTLDQFVSALEAVGLVAVRNSNKVKSLSDAMTALDNMQSAYQSCAQAVKEYNKTGYVTMDTLQSLCQLEPQYLNMLDLKNGKLKINTKTAQSLTQANIQLAKASLLADTLNNIKDTNNLAKAEALLGDVTAVISDADTAIDAATEKSAQQAKDSDGWAGYDKVKRAGDIYRKNYHTLSGLLDNLGKQDPSKIWGKNDTSKSTKQATSAIDAWSTLSSAMEEYNKQGSISLNTMKSLMGLEEKYTACLKNQGNELTIDAIKFRDMIQTELKAAAATADTSDKTKAKVAQYNQILKYLDENAKDGTISLNELRDAIEGVGASLDKAQEKTSGLKSAFGTIHDILNTDNPAGALTSDNVESVVDLIQEHKELKDILFDESGNLQINEESLKSATIALLENEKAATKDAAIQAVLQKSINDLSSGVISITDYLKGLNTELDDVDAKLDKFQSGFSDITDIVDEYNLYGKLTQDSMQKLLRLDPQYLECLEKEGDQLKFNAAQYRMLYAEQLNQLAATAKTQTQRDVYASMLGDIFGFTPEQLKQYKAAISDYSNTVQKFRDQGVDKYGNIDNTNRDIIEWTPENMEEYHDFVAEQNAINPGEIEEGSYSTVLGADENIDGVQIAFTPMLQTEDGAVPLTEDQLWNYLDTIIDAAYGEDDTLDIDKLLALDSEGLDEDINGVQMRVKGMIAAIQGMVLNGEQLTAADVSAIAGWSEEELQAVYGTTSKYIGLSMHDVQAAVSDAKDRTGELVDILNDMGIDGVKALQLLEEHFKDSNASAEKFKAALNDIKDIFSSLLSLFEKFNTDKDNDLKLWGEAMTEDIDKRIEALNKQKEALEKANDEEERAITLAKLQAELEKARTQRTVRKLTSNGYEWVADESAVKEAQDNLNDQQREWNQEDAEKAIDDQIDKLNELKDKYSEIINLIGTDLDDYNKKLKYASEIAGMTFTEMEGQVNGFKSKVLGSLSAAAPVSSIKNIISSLESLIGTLEKVNNVFEWAQSGFTDYQDKGLQGLFNTVKKFFGKDGTSGDVGNLFEKGWNAIAKGAKSLFSGSGENNLTTIFTNGLSGIGDLISKAFSGFGKLFSSGGSGILSGIGKVFSGIGSALGIGGAAALSSVPAMTTANTAGLTGLSSVIASNGIAAGAAGTGTAVAGGAVLGGLSSIPVIGAVVAGAALGVNSAIQNVKKQKEIWSSDDSIGEKLIKSVGSFLWRASGIGMIADGVKTISGWVKKIFGIQDKNNKNNSSNSSTNGKINVGDIVINSPDKPASEDSSTSQTEPSGKKQSFWDKLWSSKFWFWNWGKKASGSKYIEESAPYNVDEQGPELIVRKPESGRYTYLETGDGVVPADITSKLFELGGNPDKWFSDQLSKHAALSNVQNHTVEGSISVGDIYIQNPVGDTDTLAKEIIRDLPIKLRQQQGRR